jgi:Acetyltransferase (GNAT) domain
VIKDEIVNMVVLERPIGGLLRYFKVFTPDEEQLARLVSDMRGLDILRAFSAPTILPDEVRPIARGWAQTTIVDLSKGPEAIYAAMHTNCRYKVRRAEKMGDRLEIAMNTEAVRSDFLQLYNAFATSKRKMPHLKPHRFHEYLSHADVFMLYFEDQPTCGRLVLRDAESRTALMLYSGTRRFEEGADTINVGLLNRYLHWHEMRTYHAAGIERYDFGGIGPRNAAVSNFKMSFGGRVHTLGLYLFAASAHSVWRVAHSVYSRWAGESFLYTRWADESSVTETESLLDSRDAQQH